MWIKICGMTDAAAVTAALEARADAIGFVFAPSVRQLNVAEAATLAAAARGRVALVAVALHPSQDQIDQVLAVLKPDLLQADLADFERLRLPAQLGTLAVVRGRTSQDQKLPLRLLFEGARSGSGEVSDWSAAASLARSHELILAGGLNPQNVAAAIDAVAPFGVDVSSGVESAPGRKSVQKIAEFVAAARVARI
jgi:phosphoribosylanthranilate isomerase